MGGSSNSSQSTTHSTTDQSLYQPIVSSILGNYNSLPASGVQAYTPYSGTDVASLQPLQTQGLNLIGSIASQNPGASALQSGVDAAQGIVGTSAPTASASTVNLGSIPTVTAPSIAGDVSAFLNPNINNSIAATEAAAQNQLKQQQADNASQATLAGAWRGSALPVENAIDAAQSNIGVANTIAGLENTNWADALQAAGQQASNSLAAQTANQGATMSGLTTNANLGTQAALANQGAQLSQEGLGLTGASTLGALGTQQLTNAGALANLEEAGGSVQQQQQQQQLDWLYQNNYLNPQQYAMALQTLRNQSLGLAGDPTLTHSTSSGNSSGSGFSFSLPFGGS